MCVCACLCGPLSVSVSVYVYDICLCGRFGLCSSVPRSVGCIMAELLGRRALFAGKDQFDQLRKIVRICGSPSAQDLSFLLKDASSGRPASKRRMRINRQFIEQLPASEVFYKHSHTVTPCMHAHLNQMNIYMDGCMQVRECACCCLAGHLLLFSVPRRLSPSPRLAA